MTIINAGTGFYIGRLFDVQLSAELRHRGDPIFEKLFDGSSQVSVDLRNNRFFVPNHFFKTGEKLEYFFPLYENATEGESNGVGIATTSIVNVGITTRLPRNIYAVVLNDQYIQVSETKSDALQRIPKVLDITSVGIGASHKFVGEKQNTRSLITIDNIIQTPSIDTEIRTTLREELSGASDFVEVVGITSFFTGDLIRIDNEIMKIELIGSGIGNTNSFIVRRPILGTGLVDHAQGSDVVKQSGAYQIVDNIIYFPVPPFDKAPTTDLTRTDPEERDYVGLETFSSFSGRVFLRSGFEDTNIGPYDKNFLLDDISNQFLGISTQAILKNQGNDVAGFSTGNALILINNVFQTPDFIDYGLGESAGVTTIRFTGEKSSNPEDINTASIPRGGIIVSVGSNEGYGYQPLVAAGGTATVSAAGTISNISIGYSGSGYRSPKELILTTRINYPTNNPSAIFFLEDNDGLFEKLRYFKSSGSNAKVVLSVENSVGINQETFGEYTEVTSVGSTSVTINNGSGLDAWEEVSEFSSYEFFADTTATEPSGISTNIITVFDTLGVSTSPGNPNYYLNIANAAKNILITKVNEINNQFTLNELTTNSFVDNSVVTVNKFRQGITSTSIGNNVVIKITDPNVGFANIYVDTLKAYTASVADYDPNTGLTTITAPGLNVLQGDFLDLRNFTYVCESGGSVSGEGESTNRRFSINRIIVDESINEEYSIIDATYNPVSGISTLNIGIHTFGTIGSNRFYIEPEALGFSCSLNGNATISYYPGPNDLNYKRNYEIIDTTATTVTVNVGSAGNNTSAHTFERVNDSTLGSLSQVTSATYDAVTGISTISFTDPHGLSVGIAYSVTNATYDPTTGVAVISVPDTTGLQNGNKILIQSESLGFTCTLDGNTSVTYYPRLTDPANDDLLAVSNVTGNSFQVNVGTSVDTSTHTFVGVNTETPKPIKFVSGDYIFLEEEGLTFTCTLDGNTTPSSYPRSTDYAYNKLIEVLDVPSANQITVYVGYGQPGQVYSHTFVSATENAVKSSTGQSRYTSGIATVTNVGNLTTELTPNSLVLIRNTGTEIDNRIFTVLNTPVTIGSTTNAFSIDLNEKETPAPVSTLIYPGADFVLATVTFPSGKFGFEFEVLEKLDDDTFILNTGKTIRPHTYLGGGEVRNITQGVKPIFIGFSTINDGHLEDPIITNTGIGFSQYNLFKSLNARSDILVGSNIVQISDTAGINTFTDFVRFPTRDKNKLFDIVSIGSFQVSISESIVASNIPQNTVVEILRFDSFSLNVDDPLSYNNLPLIYSNESPSGIGSYAFGSLIIGNDGKIDQFELTRSGYSYGQAEILTVEVGGVTGIPTFANFQVTGITSSVGVFTGSLTSSNDRFGASLSINSDGSRILIGGAQDNIVGSATSSGLVYAFDRVGNAFNQVGIITGLYSSDDGDNFGHSIAMSGNGSRIVIGAPRDEVPNAGGQVYLYDRQDSPSVGFTTVGILTSPYANGTVPTGESFGHSVDMSRDGNVIVVGAFREEDTLPANSGLSFVYERVNGPPISFDLVSVLSGSLSVNTSDNFGNSVSISPDGSYIAIGAVRDEDSSDPNANFGLAYIFEKSGASVNQVGILTSPKLTSIKSVNDNFGYNVDISENGTIVAVAAIDDQSVLGGNRTGLVYVFERINGNNFYLIQVLKGEYSNETGDSFGSSLSLSDDGKVIAIGAALDEFPGSGSSSGVTYLYERRTFNYFGNDYVSVGIQTGTFANDIDDNYGYAVALSGSGNSLIVGSQNDAFNEVGIGTSGAVYSYDITIGNTFEEFQILIDRTFTDSFAGLTFGDLVVFDDISRLFNSSRVEFPILLGGIRTTLRSRPGSSLELEYNLLIFINDIYQVPNEAYIFNGGSILTFLEPPKEGDKCVIVFYFGTTEVDTKIVDILETIKIGDNVTVNSSDFSLQQNPRTVVDITATDILNTNTYVSPGVTDDENLQRPVRWCKQLVDKVIDGNVVGKSRKPYEPEIYPQATLIRSVGIGSTENDIFLDNVKTFFDSDDEYEDIGVNKRPQNDVIIIEDRVAIGASASVTVGNNLRISSISIDYPGFNYITTPDVSISVPNFTGIGTTSNERAQASAVLEDGRITNITLTNVGYGYTSTGNAIKVFISDPMPKVERIDDVLYEGDFGVITGIGTTSIASEPISQVGFTTGVYSTDNFDLFGNAVAVNQNGTSFIVGARNDEFVGSAGTGLAYVFDYNPNTEIITGIATLSPSTAPGDTTDLYGFDVAMSGDGSIVAVTAPSDELSVNNSGLLYVYERSGNAFNQLNVFEAKIGVGFTITNPNIGVLSDSIDISVDGQIIVAGAASDDEGYVYIYEREQVGVGTYIQTQRFTGSQSVIGSSTFGYSVALNYNGSVLCVSAYGEDRIYVFSRNFNGTYSESATIEEPENSSGFGFSVDISSDGNTIGVVEGLTGSSQKAYIYDFNDVTTKWDLNNVLILNNTSNVNSISISDNGRTIVFGSAKDEPFNSINSGSVYVYKRTGRSDNLVGILTGSQSLTSGSNFGQSSAISDDGKVIIIGAPGSEVSGSGSESGITYVFKNPTPNAFENNIVFELYIENDSYLRNSEIGIPKVISTLQEGYYFKVNNSNIGNIGYGITALNIYNGKSHFIGTHFLDGIYQVSNVSVARTEVYSLNVDQVGSARTDVLRVIVPVESWNGIDIPSGGISGNVNGDPNVGLGYTYNEYFGDYSWGRISNYKRGVRKTFALHSDGDSTLSLNNPGITTTAKLIRVNPLKSEGYTPNI